MAFGQLVHEIWPSRGVVCLPQTRQGHECGVESYRRICGGLDWNRLKVLKSGEELRGNKRWPVVVNQLWAGCA